MISSYKLLGVKGVGPVPEAAFSELHDVALVYDGHVSLSLSMAYWMALCTGKRSVPSRDGLDAYARGVGEAILWPPISFCKRDELFYFRSSFKIDARQCLPEFSRKMTILVLCGSLTGEGTPSKYRMAQADISSCWRSATLSERIPIAHGRTGRSDTDTT